MKKLASGRPRHVQLHLIDVTPAPALPRLDRPHNRVLDLMEMLRRMLVRRRVAAPHMPALHAHPQMHPRTADLQTLLTPVGRRLHLPDLVQMGTFHASTFPQPDSTLHESMDPWRRCAKQRFCLSCCHPRRGSAVACSPSPSQNKTGAPSFAHYAKGGM